MSQLHQAHCLRQCSRHCRDKGDQQQSADDGHIVHKHVRHDLGKRGAPHLDTHEQALPTGGVMLPMQRLYTRIRPNWMVLMPKLWQMGRNSGVKMRMAGVTSMKVPDTSRITFMMSRMMYLLLVRLSRLPPQHPGSAKRP